MVSCALSRFSAGRATICVEQAVSPAPKGISRQALPATGTVLRPVAASNLDRLTSTCSLVGPYPGGIDAFTGGAAPPSGRNGPLKSMIGARKPHRQVMVSKQGVFPGMEHQAVAVRPGNSLLLPPGYGVKIPHFMRQSTLAATCANVGRAYLTSLTVIDKLDSLDKYTMRGICYTTHGIYL